MRQDYVSCSPQVPVPWTHRQHPHRLGCSHRVSQFLRSTLRRSVFPNRHNSPVLQTVSGHLNESWVMSCASIPRNDSRLTANWNVWKPVFWRENSPVGHSITSTQVRNVHSVKWIATHFHLVPDQKKLRDLCFRHPTQRQIILNQTASSVSQLFSTFFLLFFSWFS